MGLLFYNHASIYTDQVRILQFQAWSCYRQNMLLCPFIAGNTHMQAMAFSPCAVYLINDPAMRRKRLRYIGYFSVQNAHVWASFSSQTRAYTQNKLRSTISGLELLLEQNVVVPVRKWDCANARAELFTMRSLPSQHPSTRRTDLNCIRHFNFQNAAVWVSFSSPTRAYTHTQQIRIQRFQTRS